MRYSTGMAVLCCCASLVVCAAQAAEWQDIELQLLHGSGFKEPFNPRSVSKTTASLQHAAGYSWGSSYAYVDFLKSDAAERHAEEFFAEAYVYPSLSRLTGRSWSASIVKDVALSAGVNYGEKNDGANPKALLAGVIFFFDLPSFAFAQMSTHAYFDRGEFKGQPTGCQGDGYQITPAWSLPFQLSTAKLTFEGFVDYTSAHGQCHDQLLTQPQLRVDVGDFFGMPKKLFAGIEYQYWQNKFGIKGLNDEVPQALLVWKF